MKEFRLSLPHRPSELANVAEALARKGVNLKSVAGLSEGNKATIALVGHDVNALRQALQEARIRFEEVELLTVEMEDQPGQLADLAAKLSNAGVNLTSLYVLGKEGGKVQLGLTTDQVPKAKKALGQ
ncbi:MAG: hypothetical protein A2Z21_08345 [Candidatus Fraserbacteria bacterium RBG_16_55_9]|uniref:ACT domain-containing protein n=1 Tax=Fraserbacteria sp. (strain RBG_16_55_9) TaxID=1817864 RepID=A0A1F5UTM9_FRAXR|nr:MAG: hypothetical protein A2Z21_08345 [Candidatus Fraserbacteria bacterium RBG_16_55_9]